MNLKKFSMIGAVITALLSTMCCLPAFLFLLFGISSAYLSFLTTLDVIRIPFAIFSVFLLGLAIYKNKNCKDGCSVNSMQLSKAFISILVLLVAFLLFYPEILPYFLG